MSAELALARIEAILAELERLDAASGGLFRQANDREAHDLAARILRRMVANEGKNAPQKTEKRDHAISSGCANA